MFSFKVTKTVDKMDELTKAIQVAASKELLVGIKEPGAAIEAYNLETGDPYNNIPAQPFLLPGVTNAIDDTVRTMVSTLYDALTLDEPVEPMFEDAFNTMGELQVASIVSELEKQHTTEASDLEKYVIYEVIDG